MDVYKPRNGFVSRVKRPKNHMPVAVFKGSDLELKGRNITNSTTNLSLKIIGILVLSASLLSLSFLSCVIFVPAVRPTPKAMVLTSFNTFIGRYANGTYYASDLMNGTIYAVDRDSASTLINSGIYWANAHEGGGRVQIGNGSFLLSETIVPKSNVYLQASPSAIIFENRPAFLASSISLVACSSVQNFTLDGGVWDANKGRLSDHRDTGTWHENFDKYLGIAFYGGSNNRITVKNVILRNVIGHGIDFMSVANGTIYNCTVINSGDNPITVESTDPSFQSNTTVRNCYVVGGQDVGINTWVVSNVTIQGCTVTSVTQHKDGSHWGIAAEYSTNIAIINNHVSSCDYNIVSTSDNVLIANNTVDGIYSTGANFGIMIATAHDNIVRDNTIKNVIQTLGTYRSTETFNTQFINNICGVGSTTTDGGYTWIAGTNITITGGVMYSTNTNGCIILVSANNTQIVGVTFLGTNGLTDYGTPSHNVYCAYNDFLALTGTNVSLPNCSNVTQTYNIG
jgi:hypothetical protein